MQHSQHRYNLTICTTVRNYRMISEAETAKRVSFTCTSGIIFWQLTRLPFVDELCVFCVQLFLDFMSIWTSFCFRGLVVLFSRSTDFCFQPCWFCVSLDCLLCTRFWWRVLLSCRLTRLNFNSYSFCFDRRFVLSFRQLPIVCDQDFLLLLTVVKQYKFGSGRPEYPDFARLVYCCTRFWWRVLLSCRLTRLNFNSYSFCFDRRFVLSFRQLPIVCDQDFLLLLTVVKQYKFGSARPECPDFARLVHCSTRF